MTNYVMNDTSELESVGVTQVPVPKDGQVQIRVSPPLSRVHARGAVGS